MFSLHTFFISIKIHHAWASAIDFRGKIHDSIDAKTSSNSFLSTNCANKRRQPSSTLKLIRKFTLYRVSITAISCKWALEYSNDIFILFTSLKVSIASQICLNAVLLQYRKEKKYFIIIGDMDKVVCRRCCYTINKYKGFYHDFKWSAWCNRFSLGRDLIFFCFFCQKLFDLLLNTCSERGANHEFLIALFFTCRC